MPSLSMGKSDLSSLLKVSIPLMLTGATESIMMFSDRAFLAHHSIEAMNVASATFMMTAVFVFFGVAIAGIAEVLAGQYNGEKRFDLVSRPIWQMIWFSLSLFLFFIPLGIWGKSWLLPDNLRDSASGYFTIICFSAPLWSMQVAFSGFFACTGRSYWLTPVAIIANVINIILDYFLIFGIGSIPALGAEGAAIATSIAQLIHVLILLSLFLRKREHETYRSRHVTWHPKEILQGLKVGFPNAVSHGVEISAWAFLYRIAAGVSAAHLTVLSAISAIHMLLGFLNEGLKQGVVAIASNLIGAKKFSEIPKLIGSGVKLQAIIGSITFLPMIIFSSELIGLLGEVAKQTNLHPDLKMGLICMWFFIIFDGLVWVVNGTLTAGGDTRVTMLINIGTAWIVAALPCWYLLTHTQSAAWTVPAMTAIYAGVNFVLHLIRYRQNKWQTSLTSKQ